MLSVFTVTSFVRAAEGDPVALPALPPELGLRLKGPVKESLSENPRAAAAAGDVNGDGRDDVLVSTGEEVFLVFGTSNPPGDGIVSLTGDATGQRVVRITSSADAWKMDPSERPREQLRGLSDNSPPDGYPDGPFVANIVGDFTGVGDVNGDGFADFVITSPRANGGKGKAYLVLGRAGAFGINGQSDVSTQSEGVLTFSGLNSGDHAGLVASAAGDVDNDGFDDFLVSAGKNVFLVWGAQTQSLSGAELKTSARVTLLLALADDTFTAGKNTLAAAGDVNGDGFDDVLVGDHGNPKFSEQPAIDTQRHSAFLIYGRPDRREGGWRLTRLHSPFASELFSATENHFGWSVAGVGDTDGDGFEDFLVGAPSRMTEVIELLLRDQLLAGRASLFWGRPELFAATVDAALPSSGRIAFDGKGRQLAGIDLAGVGDGNGDGLADFVIGAQRDEGHAHVVFGRLATDAARRAFPQPFTLGVNNAPATAGAIYAGPPPFGNGALWVAPAGDFNGDGASDFLVGAGDGAEAFLIYGKGGSGELKARNWLAPVIKRDTDFTSVPVPAKAVGRTPSAVARRAFTRVAAGFSDGADADGKPSLQTATLRTQVVTAPANLGFALKPAQVHWRLETTRRKFTRSNLTFQYTASEVTGLDATKLDVWVTPDSVPTANSRWIPLAAQHDPRRRTLTVTRGHLTEQAATDFDGTYAIFEGQQIFALGQAIPLPPNVKASDIPATGPVFETRSPQPTAVWDQVSQKLFAIRPGDLTVHWKNLAGIELATTIATLVWPADDAVFQIHLAGTPPVDLTAFQVALLHATETDADPAAFSTSKKFAATKEGRSLIQLSTAGQGAAFQLVRTHAWPRLPNLRTEPITIGSEAQPATGEHDSACGGPVVLTTRARYAVAPGYYDPVQRTGPIIPVNTAQSGDPETGLVVAWLQKGAKVIKARSTDSFPEICWPAAATRFEAQWPTDAPRIVIASQLGAGELDAAAFGGEWNLYFQNDPAKPGFNPNDEHARVGLNKLGQRTLLPIRSDLGSAETSLPFVLMTYTEPKTGARKLHVLAIQAEDTTFKFRYEVTVGAPVLPPLPFGVDAICAESHVVSDNGSERLVFRDRKGGFWAKAAHSSGGIPPEAAMHWFYPVRDDYFFPAFYAKPAGSCVPFLDLHAQSKGFPFPVIYDLRWPDNVPTLFIGETLVEARRGLPTIAVPPNPDGTPGVGGPCSVDIIFQEATANDPSRRSVSLIDPLKPHTVELGPLPASLATEIVGGKTRFKGLPPHLYPRLSYEKVSDTKGSLELRGVYFTDPGNPEGSHFLPNVLSPSEEQLVKELSGDAGWQQAVASLAQAARADLEFAPDDRNRELLALSAGAATGTGYVTLAFQNRGEPFCRDEPISLAVLKVERTRTGEIAVIEPDCVFDERITLRHKGDFGGNPDAWFFEWRLRPTSAEGNAPAPVKPNDAVSGWELVSSGNGRASFIIGGASPFTLGDNRLIVRYRPTDPNTLALLKSDGNPEGWSDWTAPKQANGWIKRVLEGIGPYEQRFKQLGDPTKKINTTVDMLAQAGKRWEGNVPLNCESVDSFGLIEIYETVLNRGVELSIAAGLAYQPANDALLLAASRLSDLYILMGNEAFADATDPTLSLFNSADAEKRYVSFASSLHSFSGLAQAPDLLSEELALLRGRDDSALPAVTRAPFYNRFPWNFSGDLGEVAYMANYDIRDAQGRFDGVINEADAQFYYPQGHGDAWGHYLTAVKNYYRLASHPRFTWIPRKEIIQIGSADVEVDFQEEQKFARAAAAKARTGAEIVNLTYRARYSDDPAGQFQGYKDEQAARAWGVSDWAIRAGQGAYFDWLLGNALLPEANPKPPPAGKQRIDRGTVPDFAEISAAYERMQSEMDSADRGLNPLGLERNVMPFDISGSALDDGQTYFEQIYERAIKALSSAVTTFYYAGSNTQKLRQQNDTLEDFQKEVRAQEADYQSRLIEVFGQPYREDIGPGGTYPGGYKGPDIYHFDYVDPSELLGIARDPSDLTVGIKQFNVTFQANPFEFSQNGTVNVSVDGNGGLVTTPSTVTFAFSDGFGLTRPTTWTTRLSSGELQQTRSDLLQQLGEFKIAIGNYDTLLRDITDKANLIRAQYNVGQEKIRILNAKRNEIMDINTAIGAAEGVARAFHFLGRGLFETVNAVNEGIPKVVGIATDATAPVRAILKGGVAVAALMFEASAGLAETAASGLELSKEGVEQRDEIRLEQIEGSFALQEALTELQSLIRNESTLRYDLFVRAEAIRQTIARHQSTLAAGLRLLEEFKRFRLETSAAVQRVRYKDMAFRVFRNDALQKYRAQFDLAAKYCYLAARAFDYETAFLPGDRRAPGAAFIQQIVRSRVLGNMQDNDGDGFWNPHVAGTTGDAGLADAMARMQANWDLSVRSQLGFNNPQPDTATFSLRYDLFQMRPHDSAQPADAPDNLASSQAWREKLSSADVSRANVLRLEAFNRYCIPFSPRDEVKGEPALVIPFSTMINAGQNFFGNPLVENQDQFDSTKFAAKIRSVKILLDGLAESGLTTQPLVYLLPIGADTMRSPSDPQNRLTRQWTILDQALPVPFPLNFKQGGTLPADIARPDWIPSINGLNGQIGALRRYSAIKAYDSADDGDAASNVRLVGRSVWNSQWLLIIPGRTLFRDPAEGIARFINGRVINEASGERDGKGVRDIRLEFEVYAYSGQ